MEIRNLRTKKFCNIGPRSDSDFESQKVEEMRETYEFSFSKNFSTEYASTLLLFPDSSA